MGMNRVDEGNLESKYLFKVNNKDTKRMSTWQTFTCLKSIIETLEKLYVTWSKLTLKTPEQCQWRRYGVFNVNFEHVSYLFSSASIVVFKQVNVCLLGKDVSVCLLLALKRYVPKAYVRVEFQII